MGHIEQYHEWGFELELNNPVIAIDREKQTVTAQNGSLYTYDQLVLATGSYPFVPPSQDTSTSAALSTVPSKIWMLSAQPHLQRKAVLLSVVVYSVWKRQML